MAPRQIYELHTPVPHDVLDAFVGRDELTVQLLWNRSIGTVADADAFLSPAYEDALHDPYLMTDMETAVSRVLRAVSENERVGIYSDYDCDGIPGGVILHDLLTGIGHTNFENYIPHRHHEGFGFNAAAVDVLAERGVSLIITVDCGTVDHEAVERANERGIDVIITDHHEPNGSLPKAHAILNPKRDDAYPFRGLCGAGVAFKLTSAIVARLREEGKVDLPVGWEKWLLDMVGLATIADMVPLQGENRTLAHYGLVVLRKSRRPGLQQLFRKTRTNQRYLTEDDIGFTIGPRINAASRMDTPEDAFHMLASNDIADAGSRVEHLEKLNNERKGVVAAMTKELKKRVAQFTELPNVLVIGNPTWRPALVGLTANALVDTYKRPVFLWGRDGRGVIKGSCRSNGEVSALSLMEAASDAFIEFGGHAASGGFSVSDNAIHTLPDALNDAFARVSESEHSDTHLVMLDADLTLDEVNDALMRTLSSLAPFGEENPKPLFRFRDVAPSRVEMFGKTKEHTKILFDTTNGPLEAVAFFRTPDAFPRVPEAGKPLTLIAHVERSFFMNRLQTRLRIVDVTS